MSVGGIRIQLREAGLLIIDDDGQPEIAAALSESLSGRLRVSVEAQPDLDGDAPSLGAFEP
ncbi:hypothetical protein GI374_17565 [Paracoccus sp. S-4012]|uniref:hypothetical protein n=1 Tax=Paracoccus sp. S-4012 TaxID=2665648 RepID=UPI0012AF6B70|nr:hypothetical protein [Paracoccus sp. S-4012]MRX52173.1 hypothetical protein [Paracoccus sp. S-4012]